MENAGFATAKPAFFLRFGILPANVTLVVDGSLFHHRRRRLCPVLLYLSRLARECDPNSLAILD
jgi:hypothetical protein